MKGVETILSLFFRSWFFWFFLVIMQFFMTHASRISTLYGATTLRGCLLTAFWVSKGVVDERGLYPVSNE